VSRENKFSMRQMTDITKLKFSSGNAADVRLYRRAKIESAEVSRLNSWFDSSKNGDVFIVESMGLTETERYSIVRAHQKVSQTELIEHVITLHGASVEAFNQLRTKLGVNVPQSRDELELLDRMYAYRPRTDDFTKEYVEAYDGILAGQHRGQKFKFGVPMPNNESFQDDMQAIRQQTALRAIYTDNLKVIGTSQGLATPDVLKIAKRLGCSYELAEGSQISLAIARELMDRSLQSVAATFNRASAETLQALGASQDKKIAAESVGYYGGEARAEGVRYDGACPTASGASAAEQATLAAGHRFNKGPAQCGDCPKCGKEYYVPPQIYKEKIVHCAGCNSAISFGSGAVDWKVIENYYGQPKPAIGLVEILALTIKEAGLKVNIGRLKHHLQTAESESERQRSQQLLKENYQQLEAISQAI
jgi:hypothetical protein